MSSSKEAILSAIRRNSSAAAELPDLDREWTIYADRREQFIAVLEAVGGQALVARGRDDLIHQLQRLPVYSQRQKIASLVPGIESANIDLAAIDSPHALADVDLAILPAEFAVAENAAVWVTDRRVPLRVLYFLCQHLVLVVPAHEIVNHMHAAYDRIAEIERHASPSVPGFGAFVSGPSKTADIEQSLVIGAHGPRSLTVFLLEE
ncbi:MAG: LUD domain-containing protein [Pirellulales bacterium]